MNTQTVVYLPAQHLICQFLIEFEAVATIACTGHEEAFVRSNKI